MALLLAALSLGFLGSFHCIGMCGPIALSLPVHQAGPLKKFLLVLSYNAGRMLTYSLFGGIAGLLGQAFVIAGYQQALSITLGVLLLAGVILPNVKRGQEKSTQYFTGIYLRIKSSLAGLFKRRGAGPLFLIGTLNGLLPCGLVYMGITGAVASGNLLEGALFMAFFGLGTIPVMLSLPLAGSFISVDTRNRIRKTVPLVVGLTAVLLIVRGLNLGIPYLSPAFDKSQQNISCHVQHQPQSNHDISCSGQSSQHKK